MSRCFEQTAKGVSRMRVEDFESVPRDGEHQAGCDRRQQAQSRHARSGGTDRGVQTGQSGDILVGDSRQADQRGNLRQNERAKRLGDLQASQGSRS